MPYNIISLCVHVVVIFGALEERVGGFDRPLDGWQRVPVRLVARRDTVARERAAQGDQRLVGTADGKRGSTDETIGLFDG